MKVIFPHLTETPRVVAKKALPLSIDKNAMLAEAKAGKKTAGVCSFWTHTACTIA